MIWLIGNRGMLGTELSLLFESRGLSFFGTDRECDITDLDSLLRGPGDRKVEWVINCSAYTAVDKAEDEEELARRINARGAGNAARVAREMGARMIHISTDYVFSGSGNRPYLEEDPVQPLGAYGRTKAEGETLVREACSEHFILRTAWLYGRHGKNFVYTMLKLMSTRSELSVVSDQWGSPTWTRDLALAIVSIITSDSRAYGTYHYTNEGETTWYDFAREIQRLGRESGLLQSEGFIRPLTSAEYPTKDQRPSYSVLSKRKIGSILGIKPPQWRGSLESFMQDLSKHGIPQSEKSGNV